MLLEGMGGPTYSTEEKRAVGVGSNQIMFSLLI